ncbi:MAG: hypothetical protein VB102_09395 [Paludibacter sp.]|nr:hypothetical protein [Paludibacter sp.]
MLKKGLFIFSTIVLLSIGSSVKAVQGILFYKSGYYQAAKALLISESKTNTQSEAEICYYLGNIYFSENKPDSAEIYFKKGLTADPLFAQNSIGLAMLNMKTNIVQAETDIKNILKIKKNKKDVNVYVAAGYAYLFNGLDEKALYYQSQAKKIKSRDASVYVLLGDILAKKSIGDACSNYELAIYYDENCEEAYVKYARAYKTVNTKLSIEKLNLLKQKDPGFTLVDKELGDIYYNMNNFKQAAEHYEVYLQSGNSDIQDLTKYSMTLFLNHDFAKSLEVAKLGIQKAPRNPAFNRLSMYNNVDLKNREAALEAADLFFNHSDNPDFTYLDYRYYGQALRDSKQISQATEQYIKALSYDSTKVELWKDISDMYNENNDYKNAVPAYEKYMKSLSDKDKSADVIIALGKLYYSLGKDAISDSLTSKISFLKADSIFGIIATMEPDGYRGNFWRARTNSALDPESTKGLAQPYYTQTVNLIEPKNDERYNSVLIECYSYLGYYTLLQKDNAGSILYWEKILKIDPNNATAKKAVDALTKQNKSDKKSKK